MKTYTVTVDDYGSKFWYLNYNPHCEHDPAMEWADRTKCWHLNGKRHCEHGPAVEYVDGTKYWFLNGVSYTEADWRKQLQKKVKSSCIGKVIEIDGIKYKLVEA